MSRWSLWLCLSIATCGGCGRSSAPPQSPAPSATNKATPAIAPPAASATKTPAETAPPVEPEPVPEAAPPVPPAVPPAAPPEQKPVIPAGRVIVFAPVGPLLFDLLITIDGQGLAEVRQQSVRELVERLTKANGAALAWEAALSDPRFSLGQNPPERQDRKILIATLDLNRDQLVQPEEAAAYYSRADNIGPALTFTVSPQSWSDREASRLWQLADLNADGAIDADELAKLPISLESYDTDGNDLWDAVELAGGAASDAMNTRSPPGRAASSNSKLAVLCDAAFRGEAIAFTLEQLYSPEHGDENPLSTVAKLIASVDKNLNGRINGREPLALTQAEPLGRIRIDFAAGVPASEAISIEWLDADLAAAAKQSTAGSSLISELAGNRLVLERTEVAGNPAGSGNPLAAQFGNLDRDSNGYLEKNELPDGDMNLDRAFRAADVDNDGKLFRAEVDEFVSWQLGLRAASVRLEVSAAADPLFGILDVSKDGRLSQRELRSAAGRLSQHDPNGDGRLEMDELPVAILLAFSRVAPIAKPAPANSDSKPSNGDVAVTVSVDPQNTPAPEWFVRMDLNGDGDLSNEEFLGTREQFDALDTDRDGYIIASEAQVSK